MAQVTYVNGQYLPHPLAAVAVDDRGYQFADGVYEVIAYFNRTLVDGEEHLERLRRSLEQLRIPMPMSLAAMHQVIREIITRSRRVDGNIYMQVTRGVAPRNHQFPKVVNPSIVVSAFARKVPTRQMLEDGVGVIMHPEERWARPDIKSVSVLPNILAKQEAVDAGVFEAWFVTKEGIITECSHSNAYMVDAKGTVITHPQTSAILSGITRGSVLEVAHKAGVRVEERPFTLAELKKAKEAFLSNTTSGILPVTTIDGKPVGNGKPGSVTRTLMDAYNAYVRRRTAGSGK